MPDVLPVEVARHALHEKIIRYLKAHEASARASVARAALPPGSSRARVTSANARWARQAEERDRAFGALPPALAEAIFTALTRAEQDAP